MPTPRVQRATKATKVAKAAPTKKVAGSAGSRTPKLSAKGQRLFEMLQRPSGGSFTAAQALEFARSQDAEDRAARKRQKEILRGGGPSSEGMMARHASEQSRAALNRPAAAPATKRAGAPAGKPVSLARSGSKSKPAPAKALGRSGSGSLELRGASSRQRYKPQRAPLERTSGGGVSLRGGTRGGRYKRDFRGRFA